MSKIIVTLKKGIALFLSFSIFFEALTPAWAMQESSDRDVSPSRRLLRTKEKEEDLTGVNNHSYTTPPVNANGPIQINADQNEQDVVTLRASIQEIIKRTHENTIHHNEIQRVIVLGPTGSGKTTLINGLAGRFFQIKRGPRGRYLDIINPLPNLHISHDGRVGTKLPASWYDEENGIVYWDCPGFGDPRGPVADIINAFAIDQLFHNAMKVILAVPESYLGEKSTHFYNILNEVTNLFIDKEQLKKGLSLIITKKDRTDPHELLPELVREQSQERERILNSHALNVLDFLSKNTNRMSHFSYPLQEGEYQFNKKGILDSIKASEFINNPTFTLSVNLAAEKLAEDFARRLNKGITHFIETGVAQEIKSFFEKQIHGHSGFVIKLRENLRKHATKLEALRRTSQENVLAFADSLQTFVNINPLKENIGHISFLKKINPDISYSVGEWVIALEKLIEKVHHFVSPPEVVINNDKIIITGFLLGTTDVLRAMRVNKQLIRKVKVKSDYFPFIDEDNKIPGVLLIDKDIKTLGIHLSFKAPIWRVIGTRFIDISGKPGVAKGSAGGNGGNFEGYRDMFFNLENLTVNLSGGNGANGEDGTDAKVCYVDKMVQEGENKALISREKYINRGLRDFFMNWGFKFIFTANHQFIETYETRGTFGTPGGNAGQGGVCKIGVFSKNSELSKQPVFIFNGENGIPGQRGKDGKTYRGVYFAEYAFPFFQGIREENSALEVTSQIKAPVLLGGVAAGKVAVQEAIEKAIFEGVKQATVIPAKQAARQAAKEAFKQAAKEAGVQWSKETTKAMRAAIKEAVIAAAQVATKEASKQAIIETGKQALWQSLKGAGTSVLFTFVTSPIVSRLSSGWIVGPAYLPYDVENLKKEINFKHPHLSINFINTLLDLPENSLNKLDAHQNLLFTGSPLSKEELEELIKYMNFCKNIYTDKTTRKFVVQKKAPSMEEKWKEIIRHKNKLDGFYQELLKILERTNRVQEIPGIQVNIGRHHRIQEEAIEREVELRNIEADKKDIVGRINDYLQNILNMEPIDTSSFIDLVMEKFANVQVKIDNKFSWYFDDKIDNPAVQITENALNEKRYQLRNEAVITSSFLLKSKLLYNKNTTILDVGFRNWESLAGIFNNIKVAALKFKDNPTSWFERDGEVDYIAYIEQGTTSEKKDKLSIVYSGSNSLKDWVANFTLGSTEALDLSVHEGIGKLFEESASNYHHLLIDRVIQYYQNHPKPQKFEIIITGHSLGGALALLTAYYYKRTQIKDFCQLLGIEEDKISIKTLAFGAPAIADKSSKESMERVLGKKNIFRVWTYDDPVVYLSGKAAGLHVGRSFLLHNIGNLKFNPLNPIKAFWGPHLAGRYLNYLYALQNPSESHEELTSILESHIGSIKESGELAITTPGKNALIKVKSPEKPSAAKNIIKQQNIQATLQSISPNVVKRKAISFEGSFKEVGSQESAIAFPVVKADEWDTDLPIKQESLKLAEMQGEVGPRTILGWELHDVEDNGNCFYDAVTHQMQIIKHPFLNEVPPSTLSRDSLRARIQGENFKDKEWAENEQINKFVEEFNVVLAIVDTRTPSDGYTYYYLGEDKSVTVKLPGTEIPLPLGRLTIKLAATGNHFLSVLCDPFLGQWN